MNKNTQEYKSTNPEPNTNSNLKTQRKWNVNEDWVKCPQVKQTKTLNFFKPKQNNQIQKLSNQPKIQMLPIVFFISRPTCRRSLPLDIMVVVGVGRSRRRRFLRLDLLKITATLSPSLPKSNHGISTSLSINPDQINIPKVITWT